MRGSMWLSVPIIIELFLLLKFYPHAALWVNEGVSQIWPPGFTSLPAYSRNMETDGWKLQWWWVSKYTRYLWNSAGTKVRVRFLFWCDAHLQAHDIPEADAVLKGSHANYEELFADGLKAVQTSHQKNELTYPRCTAPANSPHHTHQCSIPKTHADQKQTSTYGSFQTWFGFCVYNLTFEMKGMCILVYGFMSLISTWVLMFLRSSATTLSHDQLDDTDLSDT